MEKFSDTLACEHLGGSKRSSATDPRSHMNMMRMLYSREVSISFDVLGAPAEGSLPFALSLFESRFVGCGLSPQLRLERAATTFPQPSRNISGKAPRISSRAVSCRQRRPSMQFGSSILDDSMLHKVTFHHATPCHSGLSIR